MTKNSKDILDSWRTAEKDLGLTIDTKFKLRTKDKGETEYLLVKQFGGRQGTIILSIDNSSDQGEIQKLGFYCSSINFDTYSKYDRELFIDTLNDWGFYGDDNEKPNWYSGQSWTH